MSVNEFIQLLFQSPVVAAGVMAYSLASQPINVKQRSPRA
jgi:hypothetical protein